ncbi:MAG TPA: LON peptidase substrate-binding domain-containing protein [Rhodanobacteraceae bacterium]|nr:LON peptidase substrate-binding domain-containing protein [Rhodanobacteraceae bacterium]
MAQLDLPLFPLSAVLFPGASLSLRIFEPRYLSMIGDCSRAGTGFGVCLILEGRESGLPASPVAIGTVARISDFSTLPDGLLGISVVGGERFQVGSTRVRSDGLIRGQVRLWPEEPTVPVPVEFSLLPVVLERLIEQLHGPWRDADRRCYDNAAWVGFRLAELLPLPHPEQQFLLELTDPLERLAELRDRLPRFQRP